VTAPVKVLITQQLKRFRDFIFGT